MHRRDVLLATTAIVTAPLLAGCPQTPAPINFAQLVTNLINNIQQGVRAALIQVCPTLQAISTLVPTADSVLLFITQALGATVTVENIATVVANVAKYIDDIVKLGCPAQPASASKYTAELTGDVNGQPVTINFY